MDKVAFEILGRPIYWYGLIIASGILLAIYFAILNAKIANLNTEIVIDFALITIPLAVIGTRMFYVIFNWSHYKDNLKEIIMINQGGMAIFGGILTGISCGILFCYFKKINFWFFADIIVPSVPLGQAIGRWGNFFNQEAYGRAVTNPAWQWFPASVFIEANNQWHMATFFYESFWNFLIILLMLIYRKRKKADGELFMFYLIFYSLARFVIEGFRTDSLYWGPFRVAQLICAAMFLIGIFLYVYLVKNGKKIVLTEPNSNNCGY